MTFGMINGMGFKEEFTRKKLTDCWIEGLSMLCPLVCE
jgi:hypothetical protein